MKIKFYPLQKILLNIPLLLGLGFGFTGVPAQLNMTTAKHVNNPATHSYPVSIGRDCGGNASTYSIHQFEYNGLTKTLNYFQNCSSSGTSVLKYPGFDIYNASISFNPADHQLYFFRYKDNNTYVWRWTPGSVCPPTTALFQNKMS